MRVGTDVRHLSGGFGTGGARVLDNCLRAFREHDTTHTFVPYNRFASGFWTNTRTGRLLAPLLADLFIKNTFLPLWSRLHAIDILFYVLPPISFTQRRVPQVCYILDVPLPDEELSLASFIYNSIYIRYSCMKADLVLTISQDAALRIIQEYNISPCKIRTVYLCADLEYVHRVAPRNPLPGREGFFLGVVSRIAWRKNPAAYLETFRRLPADLRNRFPLVLLGAVNNLNDLKAHVCEAALEEVRQDVLCVGRVSDDTLISYIKGARALLFPSRYEGFGLPVLEAVACGTPAVVSDIPVFRELFSDVASLHAPDDYAGMAAELERVITGAAPRLSDHAAKEWLSRFSLESYASRLKDILKEALGEFRGMR